MLMVKVLRCVTRMFACLLKQEFFDVELLTLLLANGIPYCGRDLVKAKFRDKYKSGTFMDCPPLERIEKLCVLCVKT